jgi:hypothetical protein
LSFYTVIDVICTFKSVIGGFDRLREPAGDKPPVALVLHAP